MAKKGPKGTRENPRKSNEVGVEIYGPVKPGFSTFFDIEQYDEDADKWESSGEYWGDTLTEAKRNKTTAEEQHRFNAEHQQRRDFNREHGLDKRHMMVSKREAFFSITPKTTAADIDKWAEEAKKKLSEQDEEKKSIPEFKFDESKYKAPQFRISRVLIEITTEVVE